MSKMVSKFALAAGIVLALALTLSCSEAQAADNEKRIIGTWAEVKADGSDGNKWVFNSDRTATINGKTTRYAVVADKLAIVDIISLLMGDNLLFYGKTASCDLFISTDGKTAILINPFFHFLLQKKD